jgi:hypothetical protein
VARPTHRARPAVEPAFGLWTRDDWLNDALRAAVEHAWRSWPVQFLLSDLAEWRPGGAQGLLADDGPLRVSAMGRGFTELHPSGRTFGAGVGRAGSLTPAQRHRAQRHESQREHVQLDQVQRDHVQLDQVQRDWLQRDRVQGHRANGTDA